MPTMPEETPTNKELLTLALCRQSFWELAHRSIAYGLVTQAEVAVIYRPRTRKQVYWCRHLKDLQDIVAERKAQREIPISA